MHISTILLNFSYWSLIREIYLKEITLFSEKRTFEFSLDFVHLSGYYYYKKTSKISRIHIFILHFVFTTYGNNCNCNKRNLPFQLIHLSLNKSDSVESTFIMSYSRFW